MYGGLCHAKHVYGQEHVDSIVRTSALDELDAKVVAHVPIFSTSSGHPFATTSASGLFHDIVEEILTQAIQWDNVVEGIVQRAKAAATCECQITTFRTCLPIRDLEAALSLAEPRRIWTSTLDLVPWILKPDTVSQGPRGPGQAKIAIVGMSCRLPGGATDTDKFWEILSQGLDVHKKIPADRFDVDSHYDPTGKRMNTSLTPYGCFIDEPGLFDAPFFNMSPREALQTDPMQRLALVTAYEALERSGYVPNRTAASNLHRVGTFVSSAGHSPIARHALVIY